MGAYSRNGRWMVFYHDEDGKRHDKSFGSGEDAQNQAQSFDIAVKESKKAGWIPPLSELLEKFDSAKPSQAKTLEKSSKVTFQQLCDSYLDDLSISGRSKKHIATLRVIIQNCYYKHMDKTKNAEQFSYLDDIAPFLKSMSGISEHTGLPRSQTTINRYGDYLDAIFNYGVRIGLITHNPVKGRRKAKEVPRAVKLTVADIQKIMDAADDHIKWAMEVCFNLGTRSGESELLSLKWDNVDFEKSEVLIYGSKTKSYRTVPVNATFLERLKEKKQQAKTEYLIEYKGKPVKKIAKAFRSACKEAGITYPVRMYDLRHMFATMMLSNGADLAAVSKLMGHSRVDMTANVYYQYMQGEKERAVNLLPVLVAV